MQVRFGKRKKIQFSDKTHPTRGIVSVVLGILALLFLILLCVLSCREGGDAGIGVGFAGLGVFAMSVAGFILALRCYREEDIYMITPTAGSILNGLLTLVFMVLFFIGAM
jgi:hypothetical protein